MDSSSRSPFKLLKNFASLSNRGTASSPPISPLIHKNKTLLKAKDANRYAAMEALDDERENERCSNTSTFLSTFEHEENVSFAQILVSELLENVKNRVTTNTPSSLETENLELSLNKSKSGSDGEYESAVELDTSFSPVKKVFQNKSESLFSEIRPFFSHRETPVSSESSSGASPDKLAPSPPVIQASPQQVFKGSRLSIGSLVEGFNHLQLETPKNKKPHLSSHVHKENQNPILRHSNHFADFSSESYKIFEDEELKRETILNESLMNELSKKGSLATESLINESSKNELVNKESLINESSKNELVNKDSLINESSKNESSKNGSSKNELLKKESSANECLKNELSKEKFSANESLINESSMNELSKEKSSANESLTNESSINELSKEESLINKSSMNELSKEKFSANESLTNESSMNELSKEKSSANESLINESSMNELSKEKFSANEALTNESSMNELVNKESLNNESSKNELVNKESLNNESSKNEFLTNESSEDEYPKNKSFHLPLEFNSEKEILNDIERLSTKSNEEESNSFHNHDQKSLPCKKSNISDEKNEKGNSIIDSIIDPLLLSANHVSTSECPSNFESLNSCSSTTSSSKNIIINNDDHTFSFNKSCERVFSPKCVQGSFLDSEVLTQDCEEEKKVKCKSLEMSQTFVFENNEEKTSSMKESNSIDEQIIAPTSGVCNLDFLDVQPMEEVVEEKLIPISTHNYKDDYGNIDKKKSLKPDTLFDESNTVNSCLTSLSENKLRLSVSEDLYSNTNFPHDKKECLGEELKGSFKPTAVIKPNFETEGDEENNELYRKKGIRQPWLKKKPVKTPLPTSRKDEESFFFDDEEPSYTKTLSTTHKESTPEFEATEKFFEEESTEQNCKGFSTLLNSQSVVENKNVLDETLKNSDFDVELSSMTQSSYSPLKKLHLSSSNESILDENFKVEDALSSTRLNGSLSMPLVQVSDVLARTELLCQSKLLEKDKEIHLKEKHIDKLENEILVIGKEKETIGIANRQMLDVVEQYEKTISEIISGRERDRICMDISKEKLLTDKLQLVEDLQSAERAFNDVHRKYERMKEVIFDFRKNENSLKATAKHYLEKFEHSEQKYASLKAQAEEKISEANERLGNLQRSGESRIVKLTAMLRKAEMKVASLERNLEERIRENQELTTICDDLINRVEK